MVLPIRADRVRMIHAGVPILSALLLYCLCTVVYACEIPVCQYALENWEADSYEAIVFHRGELTAAEREAVGLLRAAAASGNLAVNTVDLATNRDSILLQRWREQATEQLPWVAAYYPRELRNTRPVWAGPLRAPDMRALVDSPLRRTIASELAGRVTASWVLLESGNRGKDNAAAALLERELRRLEQTLVLPVLEAWGPNAGPVEPPPVRFTLHRLSRASASEQMMVNTLLYSESDLASKFSREPLAFPIYGRGLILYALAGPGINEWTITKAAEFITGPCSCEVKAGNPGTDILMSVDWNAAVKQTVQERMPPPVGMANFQDRAAEAERLLAEVDARAAAARAAPSAAQPRSGGTPATPPRATAPRALDLSEPTTSGMATVPAPPAAEGAVPAVERPSQPASSSGEVAGPPAPAEPAAQTAEAEQERAEEPGLDEGAQQQMAAGTMPGNDNPDAGGVAGLVGILALVAAAITVTVGFAVVLRRRGSAAKDEEHERVPT